mmetsp:Transcript_122957/g.244642  ORF Transcript_122957/g.244642 Transcript_122957/m.244642 type:complete len:110 (-) Transcript_122957:130-459(-)
MSVSWTRSSARVGAEDGAAGAASAGEVEVVGIAVGVVADVAEVGVVTVAATKKKLPISHGKAGTVHCISEGQLPILGSTCASGCSPSGSIVLRQRKNRILLKASSAARG